MSERVRLASVGLGWWGGVLADAARDSGQCTLVTCFARSTQARQSFAQTHACGTSDSLDAVLADPQVQGVLLATPHSTHADLAVAAAEAGKHVFIDKPFALTVEDAQRAIDATARAGVVLQIGHHRRRLIGNRRLKDLVDGGQLGVVHQLEATYFVPKYQTPLQTWRGDPSESPVGGMTGLGVHMLDTFQYLAGPVARVSAFSKRLLGRWALDDATVVGLEFHSAPLGYLGTSLVLPRTVNVGVYGTDAAAWSEEDGTRLYVQSKDHPTRSERAIDSIDPLADQLAEFAECIRGTGRPETGGAEGIEVVAVLQAIDESVRSGHAVEVSQFRDRARQTFGSA